MQSHHTIESEAIARLADQLPDALRADWLAAMSQWIAQYRRGVMQPIPAPDQPTPKPAAPLAPCVAEPFVDDAEPEIDEPEADEPDPADDDMAVLLSLSSTDRSILRDLARRIEPASARDVADVLCIEPRSVSNRICKSKPLRVHGLVEGGGGYRVTDRGRAVSAMLQL